MRRFQRDCLVKPQSKDRKNKENWEIVKNKNIWGVSERNKNKISQVAHGDIIVFYIVGEKVFAGIYEAVSVMYKNANRLFEPY